MLYIFWITKINPMKIIFLTLSVFAILFQACSTGNTENDKKADDFYRQEMRFFVQLISAWSRTINDSFIIIPQNGNELVTNEQGDSLIPAIDYLNAIDAVGREDLFYGYNADNQATPAAEREYLLDYLGICLQNNVSVLTTDYCYDHAKMDDSYSLNASHAFISFAAPERELNIIPDYPVPLYNENSNDISTIADAKNFLYLINPENYASKQEFISAVSATNYDVILIDAFFDDILFSYDEISQLRTKNNGGKRLVIAYMSIGEAENYRYYWQSSWKSGSPDWIVKENPNWAGNYKVKYWNSAWQEIIFGNENSYLQKILNAGFDGVYLDIIDAFEYFEN
jgi:cysteinyl-tRNA synthetase, unknown class